MINLDTARITHDTGKLTAKFVDQESNLILIVANPDFPLDSLPYGEVLGRRARRTGKKFDAHCVLTTELPNKAGTRVSLAALDPTKTPFDRLTLARELVAAHLTDKPARLAIAVFGLGATEAELTMETVIAAALAADFRLPTFKSKPAPHQALKTLHLYGLPAGRDFARTVAEARGNNLARSLTALPPNELTPGSYRRRVEKLARTQGWHCEFLDTRKLGKLGAGAFLAVAQGSPEADAGILHLRYEPKKKSKRPALALVGKGICFDTGGTNLKPAKYMHGMHEDMEGSAVALGTLLALSALKVDFPVDCWLALAQNHIGPKAYKQNDIVRAANGKTIEVMHTDAEGRMVLADTLTLASRRAPALTIDYATLTGACVAALSTRLSGAVTNRMSLIPSVIEAGLTSGERVWPFPLERDFDKALESQVADIKQCTLDSEADQILAASFLRGFIENDCPWLHIDLSAGNHKGGLAHVPTDVTGFGVRFTLNLLLDQQVLNPA